MEEHTPPFMQLAKKTEALWTHKYECTHQLPICVRLWVNIVYACEEIPSKTNMYTIPLRMFEEGKNVPEQLPVVLQVVDQGSAFTQLYKYENISAQRGSSLPASLHVAVCLCASKCKYAVWAHTSCCSCYW